MDLDKESVRKAALAFTAVTEITVYTMVGYWLGNYLDQRFNLNPWLAGLFTLLGFVRGFYRLYKVFKQDDDSRKNNGNNGA